MKSPVVGRACCLEEEAVVALGLEGPGLDGWRCLGVSDSVPGTGKAGGECLGPRGQDSVVGGEWPGLSVLVSVARTCGGWWIVWCECLGLRRQSSVVGGEWPGLSVLVFVTRTRWMLTVGERR
jgi:hypothetical protein